MGQLSAKQRRRWLSNTILTFPWVSPTLGHATILLWLFMHNLSSLLFLPPAGINTFVIGLCGWFVKSLFKKNMAKFSCTVCDLTFKEEFYYNSHMKGRPHQMVLNGEAPDYKYAKMVLHQKPWTPKKKDEKAGNEKEKDPQDKEKVPLLPLPEKTAAELLKEAYENYCTVYNMKPILEFQDTDEVD